MTQILLLGFCRKATDLNESRPKVKSVQSVPLDLWSCYHRDARICGRNAFCYAAFLRSVGAQAYNGFYGFLNS